MEMSVGQRESNTHSPPPTAIAEAFFSKVLREPVSGVLEGPFLEYSLVEGFCIGVAQSPHDRDHENQIGACLTDRGIIRVIIMTRGGNACTSRTAGEGRIKASLLCALVLVAMATFITWHLGKGEREKEGERGKMERDRRKKGMESTRKREKRKMSWGKGDGESKTSGGKKKKR